MRLERVSTSRSLLVLLACFYSNIMSMSLVGFNELLLIDHVLIFSAWSR